VSVISLIAASDARLSQRWLAAPPPRWLRRVMLWATRFGDGWHWLLAAASLGLGGGDGREVLPAAVLCAAVANTLQIVFKRGVRRPRPSLGGGGAIAAAALLDFDRYSFPSGHATNAFALGTLLSLAFPSLAAPSLAAAALVAASRVVLGRHYASDVLAGALLGSATGTLVFALLLAAAA
jgi:undecaprenyl-diphosphatase